ncbi:hypothetical protein ACFU98_33035 [Streptomyces sp. NPDC057575]|uniref:hypothetical protein n=1 Tax=unclassified Streptomyces TaxID=2593676 RepID=UPI0036B6F7B7
MIAFAVPAAYCPLFRFVERAVEKFNGPAWVKGAAGALIGYARGSVSERKQQVSRPGASTSTGCAASRNVCQIPSWVWLNF